MRHGSLFSGIGGFDLAAEWMGWENIFHCEWNEFGQKILKHYWPNAITYGDITKTDFTIHRGNIDILTGEFPCQPFSAAGKRKGTEDDRHLWPEMLRTIREIQPTWIVGENVRGLTNWDGGVVFDQVQADLEAEGYEVTPFLLPACAVNAPHRRDRIWFVAHSVNGGYNTRRETERKENGLQGLSRKAMDTGEFNRTSFSSTTPDTQSMGRGWRGREEDRGGWENDLRQGFSNTQGLIESGPTSNPNGSERHEGGMHKTQRETAERHVGTFDTWNGRTAWQDFPTCSPVCSRNDGFPGELVDLSFPKWRNESIKALGNSVIPQLVLMIFKSIQEYENIQNNKT